MHYVATLRHARKYYCLQNPFTLLHFFLQQSLCILQGSARTAQAFPVGYGVGGTSVG